MSYEWGKTKIKWKALWVHKRNIEKKFISIKKVSRVQKLIFFCCFLKTNKGKNCDDFVLLQLRWKIDGVLIRGRGEFRARKIFVNVIVPDVGRQSEWNGFFQGGDQWKSGKGPAFYCKASRERQKWLQKDKILKWTQNLHPYKMVQKSFTW